MSNNPHAAIANIRIATARTNAEQHMEAATKSIHRAAIKTRAAERYAAIIEKKYADPKALADQLRAEGNPWRHRPS